MMIGVLFLMIRKEKALEKHLMREGKLLTQKLLQNIPEFRAEINQNANGKAHAGSCMILKKKDK